jgi:RHS repeat-associated protein
MGSVRGMTNEYGVMAESYEYDVFGTPYEGDLNRGMNLGYTGKPYDVTTGMYNYGYRDYQPVAARVTSEDPVRDGVNWFAYVNNDPINYIDLWGLSADDKNASKVIEEDWNNVPIVEGEGFVFTFSSISKQESDKQLNNAFADKAMERLGPTSYVYGGKIPEIDGGVDCSGLVDWSAEQVTGEKILDRRANEQVTDPNLTSPGDNSRGTVNAYDWNGDGRYDHVTINLGDGTEINPFGNEDNLKSNPAAIIIMPITSLKENQSMTNRQMNWGYILDE